MMQQLPQEVSAKTDPPLINIEVKNGKGSIKKALNLVMTESK